VSRRGDMWLLGPHTILCADAREPSSYATIMGDEKAETVITDPPYNLRIQGVVSGNGRTTHREFVQGSGEMTEAEFIAFLITAFTWMAAYVKRGGLAYLFCDWRHIFEFVSAGRSAFAELKNICIWDKQVGGMGSFYRSQHEMILLFKAHRGRHRNNIMLGKHGRSRSNVWSLPGLNSFGEGRDDALAMHPTVKPAKMIADIMLDCTSRHDIVLDPFAGSGTILIAAEMTGRIGRAIELDEAYVDVAVRRWEAYSGKNAVLAGTGQTFDQVSAERNPAVATVAPPVAE
jgi:DNA modification methylase